MEKNYKTILLTILTISVFTIAIIELMGISRNSLLRRFEGGHEGVNYSKSSDMYPEQTNSRSQKVAEMPKTTMQFYETKYSFGKQPEGKVLKHTFRFKNTGVHPLMIAKTDVTCGCTVPNFPEGPIAPGSDGEITVVFNTAGKSGMQQKNIIVHTNSLPESVSIGIEADIR